MVWLLIVCVSVSFFLLCIVLVYYLLYQKLSKLTIKRIQKIKRLYSIPFEVFPDAFLTDDVRGRNLIRTTFLFVLFLASLAFQIPVKTSRGEVPELKEDTSSAAFTQFLSSFTTISQYWQVVSLSDFDNGLNSWNIKSSSDLDFVDSVHVVDIEPYGNEIEFSVGFQQFGFSEYRRQYLPQPFKNRYYHFSDIQCSIIYCCCCNHF